MSFSKCQLGRTWLCYCTSKQNLEAKCLDWLVAGWKIKTCQRAGCNRLAFIHEIKSGGSPEWQSIKCLWNPTITSWSKAVGVERGMFLSVVLDPLNVFFFLCVYVQVMCRTWHQKRHLKAAKREWTILYWLCTVVSLLLEAGEALRNRNGLFIVAKFLLLQYNIQ